ncbi:interferon-induced protein 44-like [Mercenaria mercenaria]|uniref:interferon-induced protein 44-like n=1 Tax=Mercenaria mercenaria TaxID=6596 RepID=UPI00234E8CEB|nr:interferon-induced protein 44-like [Mercenaria mercenaria]
MDFFKKLFGSKQKGKAQQMPEEVKQPEDETSYPDIIYDKPWREYDFLEDNWDKKYSDTLLAEIYETTAKYGRLNIMMLGQVQSGKSSIINSYFTITEKRIASRTKVGKADSSFSLEFHAVPGEGQLKHIVFHDVMGLELADDQGIHMDDISSAAKGKLQPGTQFNPLAPAKVQDAADDRVIHCVIYIVDAENIFSEVVGSFKSKVKKMENILKIGPNRMVILTKVDNISNQVKDDIRKIFKSENVKKAVESAQNVFGVPKNYVFPVKNYTDETQIQSFKNIPLLLALQQAAYFGADYMRGKEVDNAKK